MIKLKAFLKNSKRIFKMQKLYFPYKRTIKLRDQKSSKIYFKNWIFKKKY